MPLQAQREQIPQDQLQEEDEEEVGEVYGGRMQRIYKKVYEMTIRFASTRIGQFVIERGDRALRVIEDTSKWSLPRDDTDIKLERPLPWLPFLWMIIWLRVIRLWLSVGGILIGNGPVTPQTVVYFVQTRRRKLRAIRFNGVKEIKRRENEANTSHSSREGIFDNLRKLLTSAICRPGFHYEPIRRIYISHNYDQDESERDRQHNDEMSFERPRLSTGKRQRDLDHDRNTDDEEDFNLTADQLLKKYANQNSENDSDYVPDEAADDENDTNTSSNTSSVSGSSTDEANSSKTLSPEETATNNEHQNAEAEKENSEDEVNRETIEPSKEKHNDSVEVHNSDATGKKPKHMPTPIPEVKKEPISDVETNVTPQTPKENGQDDNREVDVAEPKRVNPTRYNLDVPRAVVSTRLSTPGHETAAMSKPQVLPALNTIGTAVPISSTGNPSIQSSTQYHVNELNVPYNMPTTTATTTLPSTIQSSNIQSNTAFVSNSDSDSNSDLDSFVTNEDFDFDYHYDEQLPPNSASDIDTDTPRTTIPTQKRTQSFKSESSSSSSDVDEFYSPVGSPVTTLKNPNIPVQPTTQGTDRQQRTNQQHYAGRYRGKNRR